MSLIMIGGWHGKTFGLHVPNAETICKIASVRIPNQKSGAPDPIVVVDNFLDPIGQVGGTCYAAAPVNFLRYMLPEVPLRSHIALAWLSQRLLLDDNAENDQLAADLVPDGGYLRVSVAAAMHWGIPSEAVHSSHETAHKPNVAGLMSSYDCRIGIDSMHAITADEAMTLATAGHPSLVCTPVYSEVNDAAEDFEGKTVLQGKGTYIGGHVWTLLGALDENTFIMQSTWLDCGWQRKSLFLISRKHLGSVGFDCWTGVPTVAGREDSNV